jgi:hypothetical protein
VEITGLKVVGVSMIRFHGFPLVEAEVAAGMWASTPNAREKGSSGPQGQMVPTLGDTVT